MDKPLTILLTGATGYIGSAWLAHPSTKVGKIIALVRDRTTATYIPVSSSSLVIEVREGSIPTVDPESLIAGVDIVVHLAAYTPSRAKADPPVVFEEDRLWTERLGVVCKKYGTKLIFVSTSSIYAGTKGELLKEDTLSISPQEPYATNKYATEKELLGLTKGGLPLTILRFASVFGSAPRINFDRAINNFVQQAFKGESLSVWSTALDQMRPYTSVDDCVAVINFIIDHDIFAGEVYNIVSENVTVRAIIEAIRKHIFAVTLSIVDADRMNDFSFGMDDQKIKKLGFVSHGSLEDGIVALCAQLQSHT